MDAPAPACGAVGAYAERALLDDGAQPVDVVLAVTAPEEAAGAVRPPPLRLVCVLDKSGSMEGAKLRELKAAMAFVVQQLGAADSLGVVAFDTLAHTLVPLRRMGTGGGAAAAEAACAALGADGGTSIVRGLERALDMLEEEAAAAAAAAAPGPADERKRVTAIALLTDGQDSDCRTGVRPRVGRGRLYGAPSAGGLPLGAPTSAQTAAAESAPGTTPSAPRPGSIA